MKTVFIDSNIWIYAHIKGDDEDKRDRVLSLIETHLNESTIISSIQVINEFHWILERKYNITKEVVARKVQSIIKIAHVVPLTVETYHKAVKIRGDYTLSFWDSLIVASALENDASILFSEDMHNGLRVRKKLTIQNPFILK